MNPLVFCSLILALQGTASAPAPAPAAGPAPKLRITMECNPAVWLEGEPLKVYLHIENLSNDTVSIPGRWLDGGDLLLRSVAGGVAPPTNSYVPRGTRAGDPDYRLPGTSRLSVQLKLDNLNPPPGDAFELFLMSTQPHAGSESLRIERVEDLRGARAHVETTLGTIVMELDVLKAPLATRNFVKLAESGFYDNLAFHRIAKSLCIQAGDPGSKDADIRKLSGTGGRTFDARPMPLERAPVTFERGTVAIARRHDELYQQVRSALANQFKVDTDADLDAKLRKEWPSALFLQENVQALTSGSSQFFICTVNMPQFSGHYAAFAKVVEGMPVVQAIEAGEVVGAKAENPLLAERPVDPVRIVKIRVERAAKPAAPETQGIKK